MTGVWSADPATQGRPSVRLRDQGGQPAEEVQGRTNRVLVWPSVQGAPLGRAGETRAGGRSEGLRPGVRVERSRASRQARASPAHRSFQSRRIAEGSTPTGTDFISPLDRLLRQLRREVERLSERNRVLESKLAIVRATLRRGGRPASNPYPPQAARWVSRRQFWSGRSGVRFPPAAHRCPCGRYGGGDPTSKPFALGMATAANERWSRTASAPTTPFRNKTYADTA
jgi:hypothetical protein